MCLQLCMKYPNPEYIGGAVVSSTHFIGVDESVILSKSTVDKIAKAMVRDHRKDLEGVGESVVTFYISSFSLLSKVENFTEFANTKKALMVDGICMPYIHAQENGDPDV